MMLRWMEQGVLFSAAKPQLHIVGKAPFARGLTSCHSPKQRWPILRGVLCIMDNNEQWKPIPGFPKYDVSNYGRVRSYKKRGPGGWVNADNPQRILKPSKGPYLGVTLLLNGEQKRCSIHRLVLLTFVGPRPDGLEVCHNDGDILNNYIGNLRYDTHSANMQEADKSQWASLRTFSDRQAYAIRHMAAEGTSDKSIADLYGVSIAAVSSIRLGDGYKHVGGPRTIYRKLTAMDANRIRALIHDSHLMQVEIARMYNVSESTISRIKSGERW